MPHIFQFHRGRKQEITDWTVSNRIQRENLADVNDKTIDITSSIGTSIPTPIARMYLFDAAFEIVAKQIMKPEGIDPNNIYSGLVSEVLDFLELLYMHGASKDKLEFKDWRFESFGSGSGHEILNESFRQAIANEPFNGALNITLIYYKDALRPPVLIGGTSPFTFVFTAPNFRENLRQNGYGDINGLVSGDKLFDNEYKALNERDADFIQYIKYLTTKGASANLLSFKAIGDYVDNIEKRFKQNFRAITEVDLNKKLSDIKYDTQGILMVSGVHLKHRTEADYKQKINECSDFKISLPDDSEFIIHEKGVLSKENPKEENESDDNYNKRLRSLIHTPLFLLNQMPYQGNYTSSSKKWSSSTRISDSEYGGDDTLEKIKKRELPDDGNAYPFFTDFDFFEHFLIKLPGYKLNNEKFVCAVEEQDFLLPLKPIFFHLFPIKKIKEYVSVDYWDGKYTVTLKIPVHGNGRNINILCNRTYDSSNTISYSGILGIFPFVKSDKAYLNKYTVAAFEKLNVPLLVDKIYFYAKDAITPVNSSSRLRNKYEGEGTINTKSTYYSLGNEFSIIHIKFKPNGAAECGGSIIPNFKEVENGVVDYVYAIDFGTSNTHIEYSLINENQTAAKIKPFVVNDKCMLMTLLNKPLWVDANDGGGGYYNYENLGGVIETARQLTLREFIPFQFGSQKSATFRFPFRTASYEKNKTIKDSNPALFDDSNIGFNIDNDLNNLSSLNATGNNYQTNLKWLLESQKDTLNENRVSLFFRQLLLMIRTHALLQEQPANLDSLKIAFSYPISMGSWNENPLEKLLWNEFEKVFGISKEKQDDAKKRLIPVTESIAPYYCLLDNDKNIGNDVYCNIDIGGGTSDIVLVEAEHNNLLQTYCSSIKFAGKQLWGSGSGKDTNPDSNGFVQYYKKFLSKEPNLYEKVKELLEAENGNAKIEDIVSYLFSREELKFKAIFTECKELRVPLLLHYSAILFFIAKTCKVRGFKLPKTISFSGKGSEYISLLFPDKDNLEDYTYRALGVFFGDPNSVNKEFKTKPSPEPKVITAKGSVSFAANPREVKKKRVARSGDANESKELVIEYNEIYQYGSDDKAFETGTKNFADFKEGSEGFKKVLDCNKEFLDALFDKDADFVKEIQEWLGITNLKPFKDEFIKQGQDLHSNGILRASFLNVIKTHKMDSPAKDSPFFFGFSDSLIELSNSIAKKYK